MTDLMRHGTKAFDLPPSAVIAAAAEDLKRREHNKEPPYRPYSFHRKHVRKADDVAALLAKARADLKAAEKTTKRGTLMIYHADVLDAAIALLAERAADA